MGRLVYGYLRGCGLICRISHMCDVFRNTLLRSSFSIRWQDQLFMSFPSLMAFQPAIPSCSSAPHAFLQTAALHRLGALPNRITLPAACHWKGACELDQKGKSLPQVNLNGFSQITWVIMDTDNLIFTIFFLLSKRHLARVTDVDATDTSNPNLNYGLVVDCGSSGSRVFVYCWPRHNGNPHELLNIQQMRDQHRKPVVMKIKPGKNN